MIRILFLILLAVHGLIHLLGFAKAFGLAELPQLVQPISRPWGALWLAAAALTLATAVMLPKPFVLLMAMRFVTPLPDERSRVVLKEPSLISSVPVPRALTWPRTSAPVALVSPPLKVLLPVSVSVPLGPLFR